jgi:hypothetical protein
VGVLGQSKDPLLALGLSRATESPLQTHEKGEEGEEGLTSAQEPESQNKENEHWAPTLIDHLENKLAF